MDSQVYKSSDAASNIKDMINAMAEAQKANTEVQKQVMLSKIGQQQELQTNKEKLAQGVESNINQKNANVQWLQGLSGNPETPPATPQSPALNPSSGVADSGTPAAMGAPTVGPAAVSGPMVPAQKVLTSPTQPNAGVGGQPIVPPSPTQAPSSPILNRPTVSGAGINGQPIMPPSVQYNNLGYKPVEATQLVQQRRQSGQNINMADRAYVNALQKVKAGTATQGEIDMVHKMNNKDENGQPLGQPDNQNNMQTALRELEKQMGYPPNALTFGADGNPIVNEFVKSAYDIHQRAEELRTDKYGKDVDNMFLKAVSNRSGGLGLEDTKVNNAIHARVALDQYYDEKTGKYNIPPTMHTELALSLARQLSPNGQVGVELTRELTQGSFEENAKKLMIFMGANPQTIGGTTQSIAKTLADALDRQGLVSQSNRDKNYFEPMTHMYSYQKLQERDPQAAKELYENHIGGDYKKFLSLSPQQRQDYVKGLDTKLGIQNSSQTADQGTQSFDSEAEAEAANLPSGTIITINGRRAQVN